MERSDLLIALGAAVVAGIAREQFARPAEALKRQSKSPIDGRRISESLFKICYWAPMTVWGVWIAVEEGYVQDSSEMWRNWPVQPISGLLRGYYMTQLGYYAYATFAHFFIDEPRKDFWQMVIHHAVTLFLVALSWHVRFIRVGVMTLLCHDPADVFLEVAKLGNYLHSFWLSRFAFAALVFVWIGLRLVLLPWHVIRSVWNESQQVVDETSTAYQGGWKVMFAVPLAMLWLLHIFWFYLILKIIVRFVLTGEEGDTRENDTITRKPSSSSSAASSPASPATKKTTSKSSAAAATTPSSKTPKKQQKIHSS